MFENDQSLLVAHEWMQKAENDLKSAVQILKLEKESPADIVCFHSQQCVEKYLKAFPVYAQIDFPRTHDIESVADVDAARGKARRVCLRRKNAERIRHGYSLPR